MIQQQPDISIIVNTVIKSALWEKIKLLYYTLAKIWSSNWNTNASCSPGWKMWGLNCNLLFMWPFKIKDDLFTVVIKSDQVQFWWRYIMWHYFWMRRKICNKCRVITKMTRGKIWPCSHKSGRGAQRRDRGEVAWWGDIRPGAPETMEGSGSDHYMVTPAHGDRGDHH